MITGMQAAKWLCEKSCFTLTNLQLQKILYLAHMTYVGENDGEKLVSGDFEAWDYGPVAPSVYHKVKVFGSSEIGNIFRSTAQVSGEESVEILEWAIEEFGDMSPAKLVNITHADIGAWAKNYIPGVKGIIIPEADILEEYNNRVRD